MAIRKQIRDRILELLADITLDLDDDADTAESLTITDHLPIQVAEPRLNFVWGEEGEFAQVNSQQLDGDKVYQAEIFLVADYFGERGGDFRDTIVDQIVSILRANRKLPMTVDSATTDLVLGVKYIGCERTMVTIEGECPYIEFAVQIEVIFND